MEEDRSVDNLVSGKLYVTVFLVLRGIRCKSLLCINWNLSDWGGVGSKVIQGGFLTGPP